jgi:hypothetical protein
MGDRADIMHGHSDKAAGLCCNKAELFVKMQGRSQNSSNSMNFSQSMWYYVTLFLGLFVVMNSAMPAVRKL